jgi:hypothetical protein
MTLTCSTPPVGIERTVLYVLEFAVLHELLMCAVVDQLPGQRRLEPGRSYQSVLMVEVRMHRKLSCNPIRGGVMWPNVPQPLKVAATVNELDIGAPLRFQSLPGTAALLALRCRLAD